MIKKKKKHPKILQESDKFGKNVKLGHKGKK